MWKRGSSFRSQLVLAAVAAIAMLDGSWAMGATKTWTGGGTDANWNTAANWAPAVVPVTGDDLAFPAGAARPSSNNNLGAGTSFNSIAFTGPVSGYTLAGNAISLVGGINAANSGSNTISLSIALAASQTFSSDGDRLVLSGPIALAANTLTLNTTATGVVEVDGAISGSGGVTASGAAVVALITPCSYSGPTNVTGGFLSARSLNVASVVTVSGGELDYANGNSNGPVTVNAAGKVACGGGITQIGNLTDLTMTAGARLTMIIYSTSNFGQMNASGSVDLGGATLSIGGTSNTGDSFLIIEKTSAGPVTGTFAGLPEGAFFSNGSRIYNITYLGGDGNDVVVTDQGAAPPEGSPIPTLGIAGVLALAVFLALAGLWMLRRLAA